MLTAKITSKGQITIPKDVRDHLGLRPGERVQFEEKDGIFYLKRTARESPFDKWKGRLAALKDKRSDEIVNDMRDE